VNNRSLYAILMVYFSCEPFAESRAEKSRLADGGEPIKAKRTFRFEVSASANYQR